MIKHSPNVKEVTTDPSLKADEWEYLTAAVIENDQWKLRKLPTKQRAITSAYINCAFHFIDNFKELELERGMIGRKNFGHLSEFKQLTELAVGRNVLKDIYDCSSLLQYLPHPQKLEWMDFKWPTTWIWSMLTDILGAT